MTKLLTQINASVLLKSKQNKRSDLLTLRTQYNVAGHHCFIALTFDVYEDRHPMETPLHTETILLVLSHIRMTFLEVFFS